MTNFDYTVFFEYSKKALFVLNKECDIIKANSQAHNIFEFGDKTEKSQSVFNFLSEPELEGFKFKIDEVLAGHSKAAEFEGKCKTAKEKFIWVLWKIVKSGDFIYAQASDLTEQRRNETYFREIQDAGSIGYWRVDLEKNEPVWSEKTYEIHEIPIGEPVDMSKALDFYAPEVRDEISNAVTNGIENGLPWDKELPFITAKNNRLWVRAVGKPVVREGKVSELYGTFQDITERKEAELQFKYLIETAGDGFWDWYIKEDYEYMSPRFWRILGYEPEEKEHHPSEWQKLIFKEDLSVALDNFKKHIETKGKHPFWQESRYKHKNGSTVWVVCSGKVVEWDENGEPIRMVGTHTDITLLKSTQSQLTETAKLASLGTMAGGIAHEINNPLAIILSNATVLKTVLTRYNLEDKREIVDASLKNIEETVARISRIIDGMKQLIRGSKEDKFENVDFKELVEKTSSFCIEQLKSRCIGYSVNIKETALINCNRTQMSQVIVNLLSNAIDAVQDSDDKWIKIEGCVKGKKAIFEVIDSGPGVSTADNDKIFDPFYSSKSSKNGTGLGLSISRKIMQQHNGRVFYDKENKNTCFVVEVPIV